MKLIANLSNVDHQTTLQAGVSPQQLMEAAGQQVTNIVQAHTKPGQRGILVCGPGNNGGDGFVCARQLYEAGYTQLTVIYTGTQYRNEALENLEKLLLGLPIEILPAAEKPQQALNRIGAADFIVDALFGSGLSRTIAGLEAQLVEAINARQAQAPCWVLAVDIPSGVDSESGAILGTAVQAHQTVTFAVGKPGLYLYPGKGCAGEVIVADIGIPPRLIEEEPSPYQLIEPTDARQWLPQRKPDSHKYQYGHVLVIAGSQAMPGAAVLCAEAAASCGAGLVTLASMPSVFRQVPCRAEIMRLPLPDAHELGAASVATIQEALANGRYNTIVIGPGLGRAPETLAAVQALLAHFQTLPLPVIVDADALFALAERTMALSEHFILTPHVGECARLLHRENAAVSAHLPQAAQAARERYKATVVMKSAATLVATQAQASNEPSGAASESQPLWISPTGNPGMATAGSGDVLSGVIGALAAQKQAQQQPVWQAAPLGVYLHGCAGDAAARHRTVYALRASDITRYIPEAFQAILQPPTR
ncbi:NAD(P)H-hydrate dehydratase [Vampirovibrio chlorellavorus]|uniref:NAD(P)H-hydrate dehydratase n=1 Tax=Vampirovibrio chlorellavorus TaxID=758823 RepID=UPI0026F14724|nr:NAD(P)H-hydrate dehydratase [Vampirovibrio chlorellavorus]